VSGAACTGSPVRHSRSRLLTRTSYNPRPTKAADPLTESAVITTAATGSPPAPHERATASITPRAPGFSADQTGRNTKCIWHAGTHALCVGPSAERDARLRQAEGSGLSYSVTDRMRRRRVPAARRSMVGHGKQRVERNRKGTRRRSVRRRLARARERGLGSFAACRTTPETTAALSPRPRDPRIPPTRPRTGLQMHAIPHHRREAAQRIRHSLIASAIHVRVGATSLSRLLCRMRRGVLDDARLVRSHF
jgi:hypothetical protein